MSLAVAAVRVLEAFAGLGGQALGWHRAGAEHVAFIERDPFCRRVLARHWPPVPRYEDVTTFNASPFRGRVDVLTGGPPCQPVSTAGRRGGTADERWLWGSFVALAVAIDAPVVVAENPPGLLSAQGGDAMYAVLCAFGDAGYSVEWDSLATGTVGAQHRRERVFIVARRDGLWTWPAAGAQPAMFPGRPAAWPWAGRWTRHTLTTCERQWPTPAIGSLAWEWADTKEELAAWVAAGIDGPTGAAGRGKRREALPTPTGTDAQDRDYQVSNGRDYPTLGHAAKTAASVESQMRRHALPTPTAQGGEGGEATCDGAREGGPDLRAEARRRALPSPCSRDDKGQDPPGRVGTPSLPQTVGAVGVGRWLSPALPEWMMALPDRWSHPDGPSLLDAPSRPYLPDLTAELALTTEREHRRPRLRALGNACQVEVAEFIARSVLEATP